MTFLKLNAKGDSVRLLQELLHEKNYDVPIDGIFGKSTENAVKDFQLKNNLISDGIVGTKTWTILQNLSADTFSSMQSKYLSEQDLIDLASELGVPAAAVKCVYEVESSGRGFLTDGRPKILFEGHIFWRQLKAKGIEPKNFAAGNENILFPKWTKEFYEGGPHEHERLERAKRINEDAALESASWGIFQILGLHFNKIGYPTVKDFVKAHYESERNHLMAFGKFIQSEGLIKYLKNCDWARFAYRYNGPGYAANRYDTRLAAAFKKYSAAA